jgi:hypothetical protein
MLADPSVGCTQLGTRAPHIILEFPQGIDVRGQRTGDSPIVVDVTQEDLSATVWT